MSSKRQSVTAVAALLASMSAQAGTPSGCDDISAIAPFTLDNADQVLRSEAGRTETRAVFGGVHLGLELELGNRISAAVFLENLPSYNDSGRIGSVLDFFLEFHSFGTEVTLCF